ncbi:hypothetical protein WICMUC_000472 [Wickerhamomyces mucosus]|uniref:Metacaspase-1 n=1 Tax=Wickerhamomyces mucosus TaxID=1378264 RepID=A0A9P8PX90_9ASCO|nr:hypothetical protein WICMUC_000472 [Wickerhamomyces mucosus]
MFPGQQYQYQQQQENGRNQYFQKTPQYFQQSQQEFYQNGRVNGYQRPSMPPPAEQLSQHHIQQSAQTQSFYHQDNSGENVQFHTPQQVQAPPSNQPQSFGVNGYSYQYSNCSGKKKALLVGINYIGTSNQLRGCINDVHNVRNFLIQNGYDEGDIVVLTDDQTQRIKVPFRENIIKAIGWLVNGAEPNDSLFFHYSGHGSQVKDVDGDEDDGYDETIVPLDFETEGQIIDDELHDRLVKPLKPGVRLTALFDSCHSGSVLDLPYMYSTKGILKEPNLASEVGEGLLDSAISYLKGDNAGVMRGLKGLLTLATSGGPNQQAFQKTRQTKTAPCDAIMFSGSKDDQTSADASEDGVPTGAMSYAFLKVMTQTRQQTYLSLLQNMRQVMTGKYQQKPQLSASHPIDVNLQFVF